MNFISQYILILLVTSILGGLFNHFKFPPVVGNLLAGILLGPAMLTLIKPNSFLELLAQLGVICLMFLAGLESNLSLLKKYLKLSLTIAGLGVILPILMLGIASLLFGIHLLEAIFIGIVFAATSVAISVAVLQDAGQLHSRLGSAILGAAVVDDVLAVLVLSIFSAVSHIDGNKNGLTDNWGINFLIEISYFGLVWLIYDIVPKLMNLVTRLSLPHSEVVFAFILTLVMSRIAEKVGLSEVVGAFFSGLAIGQTKNANNIIKTIDTAGYTFFIPVFFVNIGLSVTFIGFIKEGWFILIMTILAVFSKYVAGQWAGKLFDFTKMESRSIGAGMVSRGEVALIVAQIGFMNHMLTQEIYSDLIIIVIMTTIISPIMLNHFLHKIV